MKYIFQTHVISVTFCFHDAFASGTIEVLVNCANNAGLCAFCSVVASESTCLSRRSKHVLFEDENAETQKNANIQQGDDFYVGFASDMSAAREKTRKSSNARTNKGNAKSLA